MGEAVLRTSHARARNDAGPVCEPELLSARAHRGEADLLGEGLPAGDCAAMVGASLTRRLNRR
jgi:hypothetical protein